MVDFAFMKANKPIANPNFHFISAFIWQRNPKRQFFGRKSSPKIGSSSHTASVERLLLFPFQRFFCVGPPSPTSELNQWLHLLLCLQVKTRPNCLRRSWNLSAERPERWLNSLVNHRVCFGACLEAQLARKYLSPLFLQRLAFTTIPA